ncbi:hypothetical protein BKA65DRAFT_467197 [Rhexocercosporidium sp. MPI-PUGE-AT-0058]|nr:hypothetical protein BKA65DRAFT_467197 [Rhexocercosporidium sp. MPI-PUGE-AT-0058]
MMRLPKSPPPNNPNEKTKVRSDEDRLINEAGMTAGNENSSLFIRGADDNAQLSHAQDSELHRMIAMSTVNKDGQPAVASEQEEKTTIHSSFDDRGYSRPSQGRTLENRLDTSYAVRNRDYQKFFKVGRVFTTLWTEGYSGPANTRDSFVSSVVYGEQVHSKIRRFVVVRRTDRSCVCLPIIVITSSPNSRKLQTLNLGEYGIIYSNTLPRNLEGVVVPPVRVQATKVTGSFRDFSLVDYARPSTIEMNVKVKDVGMLESESRTVLVANFRKVFTSPGEEDLAPSLASSPSSDELYALRQLPSTSNIDSTLMSYVESDYSTSNILPCHEGEHVVFHRQAGSIPQTVQEVKLDSKFCIIGQPGKFYKVGRVFKTLWSEPAGGTAKDMDKSFYSKVGFDELVFSKIRRFVVVCEKNHSCLCLPLYTYGGQGVSKPDVRTQDHVAIQICTNDRPSTPHLTNEDSEKPSLGMIIEDHDEHLDPKTRINFGQVFTVQHNLKVAKVGRIHPGDLKRLNEYFIESIMA